MNTCLSCQTEIDNFSQLCGNCARNGSMIPKNFYCIPCQRPIWNCNCTERKIEEKKLPQKKVLEKRKFEDYNMDDDSSEEDNSSKEDDSVQSITEDVAMNDESELPIKPSDKSGGLKVVPINKKNQ